MAHHHVCGAPKRNDDVPRGIAFMVAATVLFSVSSAFAKWQVARYPFGEVMFIRSFYSLVVCAAFILPFTGLSVFATRRPRDHIAPDPGRVEPGKRQPRTAPEELTLTY